MNRAKKIGRTILTRDRCTLICVLASLRCSHIQNSGFFILRSIVALAIVLFSALNSSAADRRNILWLSAEVISPHLHCYGYEHATTPNLDRFAEQGTRYTHAFATAGVCAPCRSAIITGMYQTSIGTQHMRCNAKLPPHIKTFTMWLRDSGYYCTNNSKQAYQFKTPQGTWDESSGKANWKNCPDGQPFFAVFNYTGCHESGIESASKYKSVTEGLAPHDRDVVAASLPPYYPDSVVALRPVYRIMILLQRQFIENS